MDTRSSNKVFLIGHIENQIICINLPSFGQVLKVLFCNLRKIKVNLSASATLEVNEIEIFQTKEIILTNKKINIVLLKLKCFIKNEQIYKNVASEEVLLKLMNTIIHQQI